VNLTQFADNLGVINGHVRRPLLVVVKGNAYGHGLIEVSHMAVASGAAMLGVASVDEASTLIQNGIDRPILVLSGLDADEIEYCVANGVHFLAWRREHFSTATNAAQKFGRHPAVHMELDTGMRRTGCRKSELPGLLLALTSFQRAYVVGVCTHLHSADMSDLTSSDVQLDEFDLGVDVLYGFGIRPIRHVANSSAALRIDRCRYDMVRIGLASYGIAPSAWVTLPRFVRPILSWRARVSNTIRLDAHEGIGYGHAYHTAQAETIGTLPVGYADGFRRYPAGVNRVIHGNQIVHVVGSVCMDQCMIQMPASGKIGDVVTLLGSSGDATISAEHLALRWQSNCYDILSGIRSRVPRRYGDGVRFGYA
jgi:alanine racemase